MGLPSIGNFLGGLGGIIGKISSYIPGRIERWKNELDSLTKEREKLIRGDCDEKKAKRVDDIDKRLSYLSQLLKNKCED